MKKTLRYHPVSENRGIPANSHKLVACKSEGEDQVLWQELKAGSLDALEALYKRHYDALYHYAVKLSWSAEMAEDHIQNLFLKIWEKRNNIGDVRGVRTYLWTALRRSLITSLCKSKRSVPFQDENADSLPGMQYFSEEINPDEELNVYQQELVSKSLNRLSKKQKEAIYLKFYEGMSYEEIEQIMQVSYQTARNYIYEGIKSMRIYSQKKRSVASGA